MADGYVDARQLQERPIHHSDGFTYHASVMGPDLQAASGANQYREHRHSVGVSAALALAGGYLDGFYVCGARQNLCQRDDRKYCLSWDGVAVLPSTPQFSHLPPLLMFMLGIWASRALHLPRFRRIVRHPYTVVLLVEVILLSLLAFLPNRTPDFLITAPITFAAW